VFLLTLQLKFRSSLMALSSFPLGVDLKWQVQQ
jgi:hypothetical protein